MGKVQSNTIESLNLRGSGMIAAPSWDTTGKKEGKQWM